MQVEASGGGWTKRIHLRLLVTKKTRSFHPYHSQAFLQKLVVSLSKRGIGGANHVQGKRKEQGKGKEKGKREEHGGDKGRNRKWEYGKMRKEGKQGKQGEKYRK